MVKIMHWVLDLPHLESNCNALLSLATTLALSLTLWHVKVDFFCSTAEDGKNIYTIIFDCHNKLQVSNSAIKVVLEVTYNLERVEC
jgi:hypothetical protein